MQDDCGFDIVVVLLLNNFIVSFSFYIVVLIVEDLVDGNDVEFDGGIQYE